MQRLEVSCAVRPIYGSLGVKGLNSSKKLSTHKKLLQDSLQTHFSLLCFCLFLKHCITQISARRSNCTERIMQIIFTIW